MASSSPVHPFRYLSLFLILLIGTYLLMFLTGNKEAKPKLGIDLQGGTRVTLTARTPDGSRPTREALDQAQQIISARVNGLGVSGSEVVVDGDNLVITVPGTDGNEARNLGQTARLYIRPVIDVMQIPPEGEQPPGATPGLPPGAIPGIPGVEPAPPPAEAPPPQTAPPAQPAPQPRPYPEEPPPPTPPAPPGHRRHRPAATGPAGSAQRPGGRHRLPEGAAAESAALPNRAQRADGVAMPGPRPAGRQRRSAADPGDVLARPHSDLSVGQVDHQR